MTKTIKGQDAVTGKAVVVEAVVSTLESEKVLKKHLSIMLTRSRKEDHQVEADACDIAVDCLAYLQELQSNAGSFGVQLSPDQLQKHVYSLAKYDPKNPDKSKRSGSFAMRVTRGTRRAVIAHKASLPDYIGKPYVLSVTGDLQLPNNVIAPKIKQDIEDGGRIEVDNQDTTLTTIPEKAMGNHMNSVFPNSVVARPNGVKSGQGKASDATDQMDKSNEMKMGRLLGKTTGTKATTIDMDKQSLRFYLDVVGSAKTLHDIALANGCDSATQYLMQCMDNAPSLDAVA